MSQCQQVVHPNIDISSHVVGKWVSNMKFPQYSMTQYQQFVQLDVDFTSLSFKESSLEKFVKWM